MCPENSLTTAGLIRHVRLLKFPESLLCYLVLCGYTIRLGHGYIIYKTKLPIVVNLATALKGSQKAGAQLLVLFVWGYFGLNQTK